MNEVERERGFYMISQEAEVAQVGELPVDARRSANRPVIAALVALALVFAFGCWTWVQFSRQNGGPDGLFTQTDFPAITIASRLVSSGHSSRLYDLNAQLQEQQKLVAEDYLLLSPHEARQLRYPYPYAPFIAIFAVPLLALTPRMGMAVWDLFNIAGMAFGLWFLLRSLPLSPASRLLFMLAGLTSFPFIENLEQGQSSGLVMFALATGIALLRRRRDLPGGLSLGLLLIKVQWLPFLGLVLLWKRRWQALLGMIVTGVILSLLALAAMGTGWIPGYLDILQKTEQFSRQLLLDPLYSHSLSGGLAALLGSGSDGVIRVANIAAMLVLAGLLLYVWGRVPAGRWQPGTPEWDAGMALVVLSSLFTDLQLNSHDLCLLVLPAALGTSYLVQARTQRSDSAFHIPHSAFHTAWYTLLWSAYFVTAFLRFTQPVRLTTLVMLLMLIAAAGFLVVPQRRRETAAVTGEVNTP